MCSSVPSPEEIMKFRLTRCSSLLGNRCQNPHRLTLRLQRWRRAMVKRNAELSKRKKRKKQNLKLNLIINVLERSRLPMLTSRVRSREGHLLYRAKRIWKVKLSLMIADLTQSRNNSPTKWSLWASHPRLRAQSKIRLNQAWKQLKIINPYKMVRHIAHYHLSQEDQASQANQVELVNQFFQENQEGDQISQTN